MDIDKEQILGESLLPPENQEQDENCCLPCTSCLPLSFLCCLFIF